MRWFAALLLIGGVAHAAPRQSNPAFLGISFDPAPHGCVIIGTTAGGPAADAGIAAGDLILAFDTLALDGKQPCDALVANITTHAPGDRIRVDIERNAVHRTLEVTLSTRAEVLQSRVGQHIRATDLTDVDDARRHYDLGERSGKTTVVGWFTDRCTGCSRVFDRIADGLKDRAKTNVLVLAVTPRGFDDPPTDLRKWFTSPVAFATSDPSTYRELAMEENDRAFFMVIDCKGVTRLVTAIAPDSDDLDGIVDEILAGAEQAEHSRTNHK